MTPWLVLILSLSTHHATARMRAWRTIKASGAAVLRDGVYLLPDQPQCHSIFEGVAADVVETGGSAYVLRVEEPANRFLEHFSRGNDYAAVLEEIHKVRAGLHAQTIVEATRHTRRLRKQFMAISCIDFFPGQAQKQVDVALTELETAVNRFLSPHEPQPATGAIKPLSLRDYQGKVWATRKRPWVDRLASAWLIRRFIDPDAHFLWLDQPADCPSTALGFDFDNAVFTHVGDKVTYEVLLSSFGLEQPALQRIGALVHYLDIGGVQPPEAIGVEIVLAGLRQTIPDDDQLLARASDVFDGLLGIYGKTESK